MLKYLSSIFVLSSKQQLDYRTIHTNDSYDISSSFKISPSITSWNRIETLHKFSIVSMSVDHHSDSSWFLPALHEKDSIGWNRSFHDKAFNNRPYACTIRLFGAGLEKNLNGYEKGGTGYITLGFENYMKKKVWHGFEKNETKKIYCYYITNKDTGSEFLDTPKTLGIAISCPVTLDEEVGPFLHNTVMEQGFYCRPLADHIVEIEVFLRPTTFPNITAMKGLHPEIVAEIVSNPSSIRRMQAKEQHIANYRPHAVCTVQTFRNLQTGSMLYLFISFYHMMGWRVIVYDRYGLHREDLIDLLDLPGKETMEYKVYYKMEINWGYKGKKVSDTADQDADKSRTYDYARVEYAHLEMILYIDADEIFFCPQASESLQSQKIYQQKIMNEFYSKGIEEMRFVRIPYSGMAPVGYINNVENRSNIDFTNNTQHCMMSGYRRRSLMEMLQCWSSGTSYDNFPKSADLASICPFHYNHWSCDGMRNGGRDFTKNRCRCKVAFDMINGFEYKPLLRKCHLMHFNDNKYRFQSKRNKFVYDKGDVTEYNALAKLFMKDELLKSRNYSSDYFDSLHNNYNNNNNNVKQKGGKLRRKTNLNNFNGNNSSSHSI
eukprot:gene8885-11984_t